VFKRSSFVSSRTKANSDEIRVFSVYAVALGLLLV
jgi:hypothetical protein